MKKWLVTLTRATDFHITVEARTVEEAIQVARKTQDLTTFPRNDWGLEVSNVERYDDEDHDS